MTQKDGSPEASEGPYWSEELLAVLVVGLGDETQARDTLEGIIQQALSGAPGGRGTDAPLLSLPRGCDGAVPYLAVGATDTLGHWPILSVGRPTALCRWRGNGGSGAVRSGKGGLVSCDTIRL